MIFEKSQGDELMKIVEGFVLKRPSILSGQTVFYMYLKASADNMKKSDFVLLIFQKPPSLTLKLTISSFSILGGLH